MAAQRTEKEEKTEFKPVPETPLSLSSPAVPRRFRSSVLAPSPMKSSPERESPADSPAREKREVRRCFGCRKKVGLTGFRCRCGDLFCSEHRYSDRHVCGYDYKAAGREAIAKENPLVKAAKVIRL